MRMVTVSPVAAAVPAGAAGAGAAGADPDTLGYLYWCRGATVETLRRELAGDLDNVVMKALRKEPAQRYRTADELREDIARYTEGRPVSAPPFFPAGAGRKEAARGRMRGMRDKVMGTAHGVGTSASGSTTASKTFDAGSKK